MAPEHEEYGIRGVGELVGTTPAATLASDATSGSMILNVWLPPVGDVVVGGMWHWTHLPLWTLGKADTSMAPYPSIISFMG